MKLRIMDNYVILTNETQDNVHVYYITMLY